ncbi:MAG: ATP-binding protein [Thermodesulfovibrionales bacterium]
MGEPIRVLIVEDSEYDAFLLLRELKKGGFEPISERVETADAMINALQLKDWDIVISDYVMPQFSGLDALKILKKNGRDTPCIIVSGKIGEDVAVDAMKAGADDYILKDNLARLVPSIKKELKEAEIKHERKKMEESLKKSQSELYKKNKELNIILKKVENARKEWESTMNCLDDMIMLVDSEDRVKRCNKAVMRFTGYSEEEIIGKRWKELIMSDIEKDVNYDEERYSFFHRPSKRYFILSSYPLNDNGEDKGKVISLKDFTELKMATDALEVTNISIDRERKEFQHALDEMFSLIQQVITDKDVCVRFKNPNLKRCYEVLNCTKETCPCYGKEAMRCWQIVGTSSDSEDKCIFIDGKDTVECIECTVFKFATPDPIYQIGEHFNNMMHILELKNRELERAYKELKSAQSQILQQEKMASIGQLAAGIAHEINNPVGFIMSNLNSLQRYVDRFIDFIKMQEEAMNEISPPQIKNDMINRLKEYKKSQKIDYMMDDVQDLIKESIEGAERVKRIVQDLKSFSRVDEAEFKMADINSGIESTINIVWNELKYKVVLNKEYGDIPLTRCNPGQLNQVFMNILVNSAQAIEKKGEINIKTWHDDKDIYISFSDTGCGIPAENINRIFEPFFTTKEVGKGTGLGLSIAYDIVKKHKGEITVQSEVGKGTTFIIKIPIVEEK